MALINLLNREKELEDEIKEYDDQIKAHEEEIKRLKYCKGTAQAKLDNIRELMRNNLDKLYAMVNKN